VASAIGGWEKENDYENDFWGRLPAGADQISDQAGWRRASTTAAMTERCVSKK
jgi:hypothetical protein